MRGQVRSRRSDATFTERSVVSIVPTARSAGLDLSRPLHGSELTTAHYSIKANAAFILQAEAKPPPAQH